MTLRFSIMQNEISILICRCLIMLEKFLLKAITCEAVTVFLSFTFTVFPFSTLRIKELDAFSNFYVTSKIFFCGSVFWS